MKPKSLKSPLTLVAFVLCLPAKMATGQVESQHPLAQQVTIYRDQWSVPHIWGTTTEAAIFGMGYAQAEDYFWQVEDTCIRALGRYAEIAGASELRSDVLSRSFEIEARSRQDFAHLSQTQQQLISAFVAGINFFLKTHPGTKPRLLSRFEPHYVLVMSRYMMLNFVYRRSHLGKPRPESFQEAIQAATGSNEWAIGPAKTKSGAAMLLIHPHQPWYGPGQFYECHLLSDEGLNFSGACFFGSPIPSLGFNEHLGWAYTTNDPDIADVYRVVFDVANKPLHYRFGNELREATEWTDQLLVKTSDGLEKRTFRFRKTHHGPVVEFEDANTALAVRIAGLFSVDRGLQAFEMIQATNFEQWRAAVRRCAIPMFNVAYADREGNIFYAYNGKIPIRDPKFNWQEPVDGNDPATDWQGFLEFDELPQVLNPRSAYVQNCNSSPFVTTDNDNPSRNDFPAYMFEDRDDDKRRAKMSRKILREAQALTLAKLQDLAFDTTVYWALVELPRFRRDLARLEKRDGKRADAVRPYLEHLLDWDCRITEASTQASLCEAWYIELYGEGYPAETLRPAYQADRLSRLEGLVKAASTMKKLYGDWKVPWGEIHRLQRTTKKTGVVEAALTFNDVAQSLPLQGAPGPLGVIFTVYSSPGIRWLRPKRYAVVGVCYMAAVEFGDRVEAVSLTQFGQSSERDSPHFLDQARLLSQKKMKKAWLYREDVKANAVRSYYPGQ